MSRTALLATVLIAAAPLTAGAGSLEGLYAGLAYGGSDIDASGGLDGDGESIGVFGGFTFGNGPVRYGVELDWDSADYEIDGGATIDSVARLKGRVGGDFAGGFGYATAGVAFAGTDTLGDDMGYLYGLGYDYPVTTNVSLGAEVLRHEFDDFNDTGSDISLTTWKARVAYRF